MSRTAAALQNALVSMAAVLGGFAAMYALCVWWHFPASPAVLTAALCVGLMRRPEVSGGRALVLRLIALPAIAVAASFGGWLLLHAPVAGAVLFCVCVALSVWLRNFGARGVAIGRIVALPFVTMLAVPVRLDNENPATALLLIVLAGVFAFAATAAASYIFGRDGVAPETRRSAARAHVPGKLPIATRMALQMASALGLAFTIGLLFFPAHWFWIVLTAFIVCSGAVGRGDAVYKGLLRLAGAIAGTLVAAAVTFVSLPSAPAYAAVVFFVLFLGIWLRQINYAFWAACATLIFALLQNTHGSGAFQVFALRVACIVIGALCAVAATWLVYPIHTEQIVRRRVADALAAVREVLATQTDDRAHALHVAGLEQHSARLLQAAPPARLHRAIFGRPGDGVHPATLLERTHALVTQVRRPGVDRARAAAELRDLAATLRAR